MFLNLSNSKLSKAEASLLSKGLNFCPMPNRVDKSVLKEDLQIFGSNLILVKMMQSLNYILVILKTNFFLALKLNILVTI